ncbi:MAG: transporter substrate-binding domain-containing protein [Chitinivibrionales bacterium]|nr:transporter substrate-binding domain-containing protein [Chitinivibrionales bacterium]
MKFTRAKSFAFCRIQKLVFIQIVSVWLISILVEPYLAAEATVGEVQSEEIVTHQQKWMETSGKDGISTNLSTIKKIPHDNHGYRNVYVGLYENKPKIFQDEAGRASGIFAEILEAIARKEKWNLIYVPCEWSSCLEALKKGDIDLMPDVAFSPQRDSEYDFHEEEVVSSWSAIYSNGKKQISSYSDLNGRRIAVLEGSIQQTFLKEMIHGFGFTVTFIEAKSFEEAYLLTEHGIADAAISNHFFGDFFYKQYKLKKTPIIFQPASLYFATTPGNNSDLLKAIDKNLRAIKSEPGSLYYKTLERWMERPPKILIPRSTFWIICSISVLLVLAGVFILLLRWQVRDATRSLAESNDALRRSEKKFRDLFHQHTAVKLLIDPDSGSIVEANEAAEKFYGWSGEQLRHMKIQEINTLPPELIKEEIEKVGRKERVHFEFRHRLADGSIRDVAIFSSNIEVQGKTLLHSIIHDITEHRKLEDQFRQSQKMESVGRLAGGVAHDYNNMLSVIIGYTDMILEKIDPDNPLHGDLTEVLKAAQRSAGITRQLLAFARKQTVNPKKINLNEIIEGMVKMIRVLIGENVSFSWLPQAGLWSVKIDPGQVDQIMANLCINARDAIKDVGTITIETGNVAFDQEYCSGTMESLQGEFVSLVITDDGCGMDKETLSHAFEPFFTTKEEGKGTGLGLATVYGIVKQNNGFINIYSEPGKGTTVRLYFPRYWGKNDTLDRENSGELQNGQGETVLLVEDDLVIRKMIERMLDECGYHVLEVDSPDQAIRLVNERGGSIDLLMTDLIMPKMNGCDLADRLHKVYPTLKTLFISGYTANSIPHRGLVEEGANFLQKPFSKKELVIKVNMALGRQTAGEHH